MPEWVNLPRTLQVCHHRGALVLDMEIFHAAVTPFGHGDHHNDMGAMYEHPEYLFRPSIRRSHPG